MIAIEEDNTPLIYHVIGQMGLRSNEVDEAFSEALVSLAKAEKSFNPDKGVPRANWLAMNVRWDLLIWAGYERRRQAATMSLESTEVPFSAFMDFAHSMRQIRAQLTEEEFLVVSALAWGYTGGEVAKVLRRSQTYVSDVKASAQAKLRQSLR